MKPIIRIRSRSPQHALGLAVVVLAGGCGTEPPVPAAVTISPRNVPLTEPGQTLDLRADVSGEDGNTLQDIDVSWSVSDSSVATVAGDGVVGRLTPVGNGSTVVSALAGAVEGSAAVTVEMDQRLVLLEVHRALEGDGWLRDENWGSGQPLDTWYGVATDAGGNVTGLDLRRNKLTGRIPAVIGMLESLEQLNLSYNDLAGPIPLELASLRNLSELDLGLNRLKGEIPPELGNLRNLKLLRLRNNLLWGRIPPELGKLRNLTTLDLGKNDLAGPIPAELGNLQNLSALHLGRNDLSGPIPPELGNLQDLRVLEVNSNALSGRLPRELTGVPLDRFHWDTTQLCSPADDEFQAWLKSIREHRGGAKCPVG